VSNREYLDAAAESLGIIIDATDRFSDWRTKLLLIAKNKPRAVLANAATALRHAPEWKEVLGFDTFADQTMMLRSAPWIEEPQDWQPRAWTDTDDIRATEWMQCNGIFVKDRDVALAVQMVAKENSYNPPKDYLDRLNWDGESRIETLLPQILGAEPGRFVQSALRCFLIGAVARVYEPGCKMDTMLVLEGPQGIRKSTAVRELFGEANFTDDMPDFGTKDASITVCTAWCIEIARGEPNLTLPPNPLLAPTGSAQDVGNTHLIGLLQVAFADPQLVHQDLVARGLPLPVGRKIIQNERLPRIRCVAGLLLLTGLL
jgi:Virulence-associated protein E-like domain